MTQQNQKIKYFLYARKSTESEDRQIQSIEDQITRLKELAKDYNLDIVKIYTEAKSAKKPNNRPLFDEMIQRIEKGEAEGILCWQINRLSRNPIDSGKISWLLQQRILRAIQTIDRQYLPEDNVLIFAVESGVANQFILDLSKNVKRGIQSKLEKGWRPGMAPIGYKNDVLTHTIVKDDERFNLIRRAWDLMLTGNFTVPQVLEKLNNEWGFKTLKKKMIGNKPLAMSGLYKVFINLFYAGIIVHKGQQYEGKHEPMITLEEYDRVQIVLGKKGKPRPHTHKFAYTGFIRCAVCGCLYTAETKKKIIKSTGEVKNYTYYHCTRKSTKINCSQRKAIREEDLEAQFVKELKSITILPDFRNWTLEILNQSNDKEIEDRSKIHESLNNSLLKSQKELDELTKMRYRELIDDETFAKERNLLQSEIAQLKEKLRETESRAERWLELTEKTFNFASYAHKGFLKGDLEVKKEIVMALGSNFLIKDGKLNITANNWLLPIKNRYPILEKDYLRLELMKKPLNKAKTADLTAVIARWQGR